MIDRATGRVRLSTQGALAEQGLDLSGQKFEPICLILGIVSLFSGKYLVVSTGRRLAGALIRNHGMFFVSKVAIIPLKPDQQLVALGDEQKRFEAHLLRIFEQLFEEGNFFYSYTLDVTRSFQSMFSSQQQYSVASHQQDLLSPDPSGTSRRMPPDSRPLHQRASEKFFWNRFMIQPFIQASAHRFVVPLCYGFFAVKKQTLGGVAVLFALISRRHTHRAGTRYLTRGADSDGYAANFVETEQVLVVPHPIKSTAQPATLSVSSFVTIRGSVPVIWKQSGYRYHPKVVLGEDQTLSGNALTRHFRMLFSTYGKQHVVNLLDHHGTEATLLENFVSHIKQFGVLPPQLYYTQFDYHGYENQPPAPPPQPILAALTGAKSATTTTTNTTEPPATGSHDAPPTTAAKPIPSHVEYRSIDPDISGRDAAEVLAQAIGQHVKPPRRIALLTDLQENIGSFGAFYCTIELPGLSSGNPTAVPDLSLKLDPITDSDGAMLQTVRINFFNLAISFASFSSFFLFCAGLFPSELP